MERLVSPARRQRPSQIAPHLLEEEYNLEDALLIGGLINSLIRRSDRVRVACLAQLVNVIAPIVTNPQGLDPPDDLLSVSVGASTRQRAGPGCRSCIELEVDQIADIDVSRHVRSVHTRICRISTESRPVRRTGGPVVVPRRRTIARDRFRDTDRKRLEGVQYICSAGSNQAGGVGAAQTRSPSAS